MAPQLATAMLWAFLVAGSAFLLVGGIGLLRLPDFYSRIHPAGITDTMGAWLVLVGLMFASESWMVTVKLLMVLVFLFITSPLSGHALAKAAYLRGLKPMLGHELEREGADD
jgi:multicomponent Na+:H+ antiporter subunit G